MKTLLAHQYMAEETRFGGILRGLAGQCDLGAAGKGERTTKLKQESATKVACRQCPVCAPDWRTLFISRLISTTAMVQTPSRPCCPCALTSGAWYCKHKYSTKTVSAAPQFSPRHLLHISSDGQHCIDLNGDGNYSERRQWQKLEIKSRTVECARTVGLPLEDGGSRSTAQRLAIPLHRCHAHRLLGRRRSVRHVEQGSTSAISSLRKVSDHGRGDPSSVAMVW